METLFFFALTLPIFEIIYPLSACPNSEIAKKGTFEVGLCTYLICFRIHWIEKALKTIFSYMQLLFGSTVHNTGFP